MGELSVIRLGHRPGRDDRMTTHVGLTARALGADRFILVASDRGALDRIDDVTGRFGGPFETLQVDSFGAIPTMQRQHLVHLTMYGVPVQEQLSSIRTALGSEWDNLSIVVGAGKVPFDIYEAADWNVAVTNQPHSEVASLAIFLREFLGSTALEATMTGGTHRVRPRQTGKHIESIQDRANTDS